MRVILVRHGQTSWNISGRAQGHTDISLDPTGLEQAANLRFAFEEISVDRIWCSDLVRAKETASVVSDVTAVKVEYRKDLRERCFGEWEGRPFSDVQRFTHEIAEENQITNQLVRPPAGESFQDVWNRLDKVVTELENSDETIVIVSHGGTLSLLVARLIAGTLNTCRAFRHENTGITELERRPDGLFLMVRYNDTRHLTANLTR